MVNFLYGLGFMYLLAMPLMAYIADPIDEEDTGAPTRFALMWPLAAIEVIFKILLGKTNENDKD